MDPTTLAKLVATWKRQSIDLLRKSKECNDPKQKQILSAQGMVYGECWMDLDEIVKQGACTSSNSATDPQATKSPASL